MLREEVEAWRTSRDGAAQRTRDFIRLEKTARQLKTQVDRLVDAYEAAAIKVEELQARRERLEAEKEATQARREELETQEMARVRLDRLGDDLSAFAATLRAGLDKLDFQGRQRLIRLLLERVVVTGDHVAIEHAIPLSGRFAGLRPPEVRHAAIRQLRQALQTEWRTRAVAAQAFQSFAVACAHGDARMHVEPRRFRDPRALASSAEASLLSREECGWEAGPHEERGTDARAAPAPRRAATAQHSAFRWIRASRPNPGRYHVLT
jgi:FtsZ-binding cell division protein ZapB